MDWHSWDTWSSQDHQLVQRIMSSCDWTLPCCLVARHPDQQNCRCDSDHQPSLPESTTLVNLEWPSEPTSKSWMMMRWYHSIIGNVFGLGRRTYVTCWVGYKSVCYTALCVASRVKCMLNYCLELDKWVLTNLSHEWQWFNTLIPLSHKLWPLLTHDCTRAVTTRYTTLDRMIEIGSTNN